MYLRGEGRVRLTHVFKGRGEGRGKVDTCI